MVVRPVFIPDPDPPFVKESQVSFQWHSGFALSQKAKSIASLHNAALELGLTPVLEVSSKSQSEFGVALSAFNLKIRVPGVDTIPLESAFQGSKVFRAFGSCSDLYRENPRSAKHAAKERDRGDLLQFEFAGDIWELEPKTAFYDWLYLRALRESMESELSKLIRYAGFTDIEFNPQRSFNCQARSCALAVSLTRNGFLEEATSSKSAYLDIINDGKRAQRRSIAPVEQPRLF